jgi:hypothetical protein
MNLSSGNHGKSIRVFISHSTKDNDLLNETVHFGPSERRSAVNAVRQRRVLELRAALSEKLGGMPNSEELKPYFDVPHHGGTLVVPGNHDITADQDLEDYRIRDDLIPRRIFNLSVQNKATLGGSPRIDMSGILSIFLSGQSRETFIGDLEERYGLILNAKGHRTAKIWFWGEVVHSFFSLTLAALKRVSGFEKLLERHRRARS